MTALRILLAEDDAMIGMFLAMTLEQMGHHICALETTEAGAVAAAARDRPDIIITDAGLNAGDGVTAAERILAERPMRFVFASGDLTKVKARLPNAVMIQKPYNNAVLAGAIETAMRSISTSDSAMSLGSTAPH